MAAAADRELDAGLARVPDDAGRVLCVRDAEDRRGALVEAAVEETARFVVARVFRLDDLAGQARPQRCDLPYRDQRATSS